MKKLLIVGCLLLMSCKGPKGDRGDNGIQGQRGPGDIEVLSGVVVSDDFNVTDSRIAQSKEISVYASAGGELIELPYFLPGVGVNTYYLASSTKVEIFNAALAGATKYVIVLIL